MNHRHYGLACASNLDPAFYKTEVLLRITEFIIDYIVHI